MKGVIFDWDGTLADSHSSLLEANAAVMRALNLPFSEELYHRHYAPDWRLMYARLGVPAARIEDANRIWHAAFRGRETVLLLPGARTAVRRLRDAGFGTALVTSGGRAIVEPQLERLAMAVLVPVRVFGDEQPEQKPDPRPLRRALEALGLDADPAEAAYLGDAPDDMRMAVTAGCRAIGIVSMYSDEAVLRRAGAEDVAPSVAVWVERVLAADVRRAS